MICRSFIVFIRELDLEFKCLHRTIVLNPNSTNGTNDMDIEYSNGGADNESGYCKVNDAND